MKTMTEIGLPFRGNILHKVSLTIYYYFIFDHRRVNIATLLDTSEKLIVGGSALRTGLNATALTIVIYSMWYHDDVNAKQAEVSRGRA